MKSYKLKEKDVLVALFKNMKYKIEIWTIKKIIDTLEKGNLNLNPPYQRNAIWVKPTQKYLIHSISKGQPIPNIFLHEVQENKYDMVDGQQRTRAIKLYWSTEEIDLTKDDNKFKSGKFLNFEIPITIIYEIDEDESIEDYYYMVNTSGIKLNRPEENKAHYFDTEFLKLVESITNDNKFQKLNIVPPTSQKRMLDRDLVEELCALILYGISDKKTQVDKIYESDVNIEQIEQCRKQFFKIIEKLELFDVIKPIKNTRYRQRNDFYTLFGFLNNNLEIIHDNVLKYIYRTLLTLEIGIRPTKLSSIPLGEYAFNCVSQSNSSKARSIRLEILNNLFLNKSSEPSDMQKQVFDFYPSNKEYYVKIEDYLMFNIDTLSTAIIEKEDELKK